MNASSGAFGKGRQTGYVVRIVLDDQGGVKMVGNILQAGHGGKAVGAVRVEGGNAVVGTHAKNNSVSEPERIADFVKREMGKPKAQFQREFDGKVFSAEELSALILKKLKADAEKYLKVEVTDAVITVPAYFNDAERTATITAGQLAGLNVLQIVNEPTAAAVAYGLDKLDEDQTVFVFDLGGGTFDVTIMRIEGHNITMLATNGDHRLGGVVGMQQGERRIGEGRNRYHRQPQEPADRARNVRADDRRVSQRTHRHAGTKEIRDFHRNIEPRR